MLAFHHICKNFIIYVSISLYMLALILVLFYLTNHFHNNKSSTLTTQRNTNNVKLKHLHKTITIILDLIYFKKVNFIKNKWNNAIRIRSCIYHRLTVWDCAMKRIQPSSTDSIKLPLDRSTPISPPPNNNRGYTDTIVQSRM